MTTVNPRFPATRYATLRVVQNDETATHWCHMHADLAATPGRACFKPQLIEDILKFQRNLSDRIQRGQQDDQHELQHVVLASDCDAFNLGGDLEYFCDAIRRQDRPALLAYASECVNGVYGFHSGLDAGVHSIALVQGDALGGGFEAALSCHTIVAEEGVNMGLPEVLFDLFPGMGAYSFLCKRIPPHQAERMMLTGDLYSSEQLHAMGLVDVLVPRGQGVQAVEQVIRNNRRIPHARAAMHQVRAMAQPITLEEMQAITEVWVDTALKLGNKSLRIMERLVRAQYRRHGESDVALAGLT